ncbi:MAG: polysaccharide deacetylase family protein [Bacteroidales bacterium]|nr:polysaccharide deacetylase family protein [Bacteroidales bacterium]
MKKVIVFLLIGLFLVSCSSTTSTPVDTNAIYTEAAMTVAVQFTKEAEKIPTSTNTASPVPTETLEPPTETPIPSPTTIPPTPTWSYHAPGPVVAPILIYNHISDDKDDNPYYQWESAVDIHPDIFRQQMMVLRDAGYTPITVETLVDAIVFGADLPPKPIIITFDSNTAGIYNNAYPIMQEFGFTGTLYVVANHLNGGGIVTTDQVKEMALAGWEIGSKGMNGVVLTTDYSVLSEEISGSKLKLEEILGFPIKSFSYPGGATDAAVSTRVAEWGYYSAVGLFKTSEHYYGSLYYLARYEIKNGMTIQEFVDILPWKPVFTLPTSIPTKNPQDL